jgi:hypothetical protein
MKLVSDRIEDPREDDHLHAILGRVVDRRSIGEDVVGEFIAIQGEQNLIAPAGVACRRRIQKSRDKKANVLYPTGLHVEHGNNGGVTLGGWGWSVPAAGQPLQPQPLGQQWKHVLLRGEGRCRGRGCKPRRPSSRRSEGQPSCWRHAGVELWWSQAWRWRHRP